jgi:hypothetical protein
MSVMKAHCFELARVLKRIHPDQLQDVAKRAACACCNRVFHPFETIVFVENGDGIHLYVANHAGGRGRSVDPTEEMVREAFQVPAETPTRNRKKRKETNEEPALV